MVSMLIFVHSSIISLYLSVT